MVTVTALVSVYNGAKFLRGRLDDLIQQTLYRNGELEIVVINSGSTDITARVLEAEYLPYITLITSLREPLYTAWNRGIQLAAGRYITNANVDDRLRPDALEIMAQYLDEHPDAGLVCGDSYVTTTENATWQSPYELCQEAPYAAGRLNFPPPDPAVLLQQCVTGNNPMWRRKLHETAGLFDESYLVAGDYEFALRLAAHKVPMHKIDDVLGLFYWHPSQLGRASAEQSAYESRRALLWWSKHIQQSLAI